MATQGEMSTIQVVKQIYNIISSEPKSKEEFENNKKGGRLCEIVFYGSISGFSRLYAYLGK